MMFLTIVLRKEVPDSAAAQAIAETVKSRILDQPGVTITASTSAAIDLSEEVPE